jgi:hypothetical protein
MDANDPGERSSRDTFLIIILCLLVGVPVFLFLNILTFGLFILLLLSAGVVAVFAVFHYFLWGRSLSREVADEVDARAPQSRTEQGDGGSESDK